MFSLSLPLYFAELSYVLRGGLNRFHKTLRTDQVVEGSNELREGFPQLEENEAESEEGEGW